MNLLQLPRPFRALSVLILLAAVASPWRVRAGEVFDRDMSFGINGTADVWFDAGQQDKDAVRALLRRPDGDVDVIAQVQTATAGKFGVGLQRVTPAGIRVGPQRVVSTPALTRVVDAVRTADGRIVIVGTRSSDVDPDKWSVVVMRLDAGFIEDPTFDGIGWRSYDIVDSGSLRSAVPRSVASLASGDIVVIGDAYANSTTWSLKLVLAQNGSVRRSCSADDSTKYTALALANTTMAGSADDVLVASRHLATGSLRLTVESADSGSCGAANVQITLDVPLLCPHPGFASSSVDAALLRSNDASSASASFLVATGTDPPFDAVRAAMIDVDLTAVGALFVQGAACGHGDIHPIRLAQTDDRQHVFITGWRCQSCINGSTDSAAAALKRSGSAWVAYPTPSPFNGISGYVRQVSYFDAGIYKTPVIATPGMSRSFFLAGTHVLGNGTDEDVTMMRMGQVPAMFEHSFD